MNHAGPDFLLFAGRFHPLLVHLPIGFLLLLAALETLARFPRYREAAGSARFILILAVPATAASALCGWLLSLGGGYEPALLARHLYAGLGVAAATLLTVLAHSRGWVTAYRVSLGATLLALVATSHYGGSLTHGADYLTRYAPALRSARPNAATASAKQNAGEAASLFAAAAQPVMAKYCTGCHGPEKSKGELRLDTYEHLIRGGESGPALEPGNGPGSRMIKRMRLPLAHEEHMPPEGKPQPSPDEITRVEAWITAASLPRGTSGGLKATENRPRGQGLRTGTPGGY